MLKTIRHDICWVVGLFIYAWLKLKQHPTAKRIILWIVAIYIVAWIVFGSNATMALGLLISLGANLALLAGMMIFQFVAIFWFMSQTKIVVVRPGDPKSVDLSMYWGQPALVKTMQEWLHLFNDQEKFKAMGGRYISGILLCGGPGTGKSFLARALSGSGGLAFVGIEGSGFRGMFWGVDVLRVISIFKKARGLARQFQACILFIDEIDSVGMSRGGVQGGGQTQMLGGMMGMGGSGALTRLLFEMDGLGESSEFDRCQNIARKRFGLPLLVEGTLLVMGSTNRPDVLDPALMRPGRFDRRIQVDPPDKAGRREIIEGYLKTISHDDTVNVESLVADTAWATPVKIMSSITKDAVRLAIFGGRDKVSQRDIEGAMMEQAMGIPQPISDWEPEQMRQVAIHEASHAVAQYHLRKDEKIAHLTITRRTGSLGFMLPVSLTDVYTMPLETLVADVMVALAGHIGTEVVLGKPWTGAGSDLQVVRQRVEYLAAYGYLGFLPMDQESGKGHVKEVDAFVQKCVDGTRKLLVEHRAQIDTLVDALLDKKDLSGDEVIALLKEKTP